MANGGMKNSPIPKVQQEGKAVSFKPACDYVGQPGNAYGKTRTGLQPFKARRESYNPTTYPQGTDRKTPKNQDTKRGTKP